MSEPLIKLLTTLIPRDAFKNVEIEVEWENEDKDTLLIFIKIHKKGVANENQPLR
ncbi:MAG: hypothetical protein QXE51_03285 [Nitrososphaeria archaeon]